MDQEELRQNARAALARLSSTGDLPVLPAVATAALDVARQPNTNLQEMCRIIQTDVGLAARVLRVANSLGFGRCTQVKSVRDAVVTTGINTACEILFAASVRQLYGSWGSYGGALWNHALVVALAAEELASETCKATPGTAFLPGLLHDVGRVVFLLVDATAFQTIEQLSATSVQQKISYERFWYGFDHALVSSILAEDWGLAPDQCDAISWHHECTSATTGRDLALLISNADSLAYTIGFASGADLPAETGTADLGLSNDRWLACAQRVFEAFEVHKKLLG